MDLSYTCVCLEIDVDDFMSKNVDGILEYCEFDVGPSKSH